MQASESLFIVAVVGMCLTTIGLAAVPEEDSSNPNYAALPAYDFGTDSIPGSENVDIVFVIDGSGSTGTGSFALQLESIATFVEGQRSELSEVPGDEYDGDTTPFIPRNGTVGVAVIQFSDVWEAIVEQELVVIASEQDATEFASRVRGIAHSTGATKIELGLDQTIDVLDGSWDGPQGQPPAGGLSSWSC